MTASGKPHGQEYITDQEFQEETTTFSYPTGTVIHFQVNR